MHKDSIKKNKCIINFGKGIDILRSKNLWNDEKISILELVFWTLYEKYSSNKILIFEIKILDDKSNWNKIDLDTSITQYLLKYQTFEERKISVNYGIFNN